MDSDVDLHEFIENVRATKPPFTCPVCQKTYKSFTGIWCHLLEAHSFDPDRKIQRSAESESGDSRTPGGRGNLTAAQAQKFVDVEIDGQSTRLNVYEQLEVVVDEDEDPPACNWSPVAKPKCAGSPKGKLPEAKVTIVENYNPRKAPNVGDEYIRYVEKSAEELDKEVDYEMDDEDYEWLKIKNLARQAEKLPAVSEDTFELLMDRLEKESEFQNQDFGPAIDENAVCCVCSDGECENANVILFCDMCNLAVHQDCYGVPYIPEGQWLCRRCQLSPSCAVTCCLCPNQGGAFKQTTDGRWAHVVCAIWVPEIQFANVVFLEPIEGFERIPPARWKLSCYVCKQKGVGACIQCHKPNCYTAFHVTCAQSAGLYMHVEAVGNLSPGGSNCVRKSAYCDVHAPVIKRDRDGDHYKRRSSCSDAEDLKEVSKKKIRNARKVLMERRNCVPAVSIPVIPAARLNEIAKKFNIPGQRDFFRATVAFWTLKREFRSGVPLIKRLQTAQNQTKRVLKESEESVAAKNQLLTMLNMRQNLEKARLLCELMRKREKIKLEMIDASTKLCELQLWPMAVFYTNIIDHIQAVDKMKVFAKPVSEKEVRGYHSIITNPMDLGTMKKLAWTAKYNSVKDLEADFFLMINNCLKFNAKNNYFYKLAIKVRRNGNQILRKAKELEQLCSDHSKDQINLENVAKFGYSRAAETSAGPSTSTSKSTSKTRAKEPSETGSVELGCSNRLVTPAGKMSKVGKSATEKGKLKTPVTLRVATAVSGGRKRAITTETRADVKKKKGNVTESLFVDTNFAEEVDDNKPLASLSTPGSTSGMSGCDSKSLVVTSGRRLRSGSRAETPSALQAPERRKLRKSSVSVVSPLALESKTPASSKANKTVTAAKVPEVDSFHKFRVDPRSPSVKSEAESIGMQSSIGSTGTDGAETELEDGKTPRSSSSRSKKRLASLPVDDLNIPFEPMDLVWVKAVGFPWYPGLIVDPNIPANFQFKSIHIPQPSTEALEYKHSPTDYLVRFFDSRSNWQWIPREKLRAFGIDKDTDEYMKKFEKKSDRRRDVQRAYERAWKHRCLLLGDPIPPTFNSASCSGVSDFEDAV